MIWTLVTLLVLYGCGVVTTMLLLIRFGMVNVWRIALQWPIGLPTMIRTWWVLRKMR